MGFLQIHPCHAGTDATLMASLSVMSGSPQAQQFISTSTQSELCSHAFEIEGGAPQVARALRHSASVAYIEPQSAPSQLQKTGSQSDPFHVYPTTVAQSSCPVRAFIGAQGPESAREPSIRPASRVPPVPGGPPPEAPVPAPPAAEPPALPESCAAPPLPPAPVP